MLLMGVSGDEHFFIIDIVQLAMVSSIDGINQTTPPTNNGHAPMKKELSICPSLLCLDLVSFSRVVSNNATDASPGGAHSSIPSSFSLATTLLPETRTLISCMVFNES